MIKTIYKKTKHISQHSPLLVIIFLLRKELLSKDLHNFKITTNDKLVNPHKIPILNTTPKYI